jgi:filamentous hemagglutinin family protein
MTSRIPAHLLRPALLSPLVLLLSLDAAAAGPSAGAISVSSATVSPAGNVTSVATLNRISGGAINTGASVTGNLQSNPSVMLINPSGVLIQAGSQLPTGGSVSTGSASFNVQGNVLTVTNSSGAVINWQDFSIGSGATTNFVQPSTSSVVLNRVVGQNASTIAGTLSSNGRVFLTNPNGALFTSGAQINTAGFTATTNNISNAEFLAGSNGASGSGSTLIVDGPLSVQGGNLSVTNGSIDLTGSLTAPGALTLTAGTLKLNGVLNVAPITPGPVRLNTPGNVTLTPGNVTLTTFQPQVIGTLVVSDTGTNPNVVTVGTGGTQSTGGTTKGAPVLLTAGAVSAGSTLAVGNASVLLSAGSAPAAGHATGRAGTITLAATGGTAVPTNSSVSVAAATLRPGAATFTLHKREPMF